MKKDNIRKKEEKSEVKKRKKIFIYGVIAFISIILIYIFTTYILTVTDVINEGFFRINDFVITSKVNVEEIFVEGLNSNEINIYTDNTEIETDINNDLEIQLNVSQENIFSFLISKSETTKPQRIYLNNIKIIGLNKNIYTKNIDEKEIMLNNIDELDLEYEENEGQYLIEFNLLNKNIIENVKFPEGTDTVIYDGTILKKVGYNTEDMKYTFKARLNIVDTTGKTSMCNIEVQLPKGELGENGIVIERQNLRKYNLKLKTKILEIFE